MYSRRKFKRRNCIDVRCWCRNLNSSYRRRNVRIMIHRRIIFNHLMRHIRRLQFWIRILVSWMVSYRKRKKQQREVPMMLWDCRHCWWKSKIRITCRVNRFKIKSRKFIKYDNGRNGGGNCFVLNNCWNIFTAFNNNFICLLVQLED